MPEAVVLNVALCPTRMDTGESAEATVAGFTVTVPEAVFVQPVTPSVTFTV